MVTLYSSRTDCTSDSFQSKLFEWPFKVIVGSRGVTRSRATRFHKIRMSQDFLSRKNLSREINIAETLGAAALITENNTKLI